MSYLSQYFGGQRATAAIVNAHSSGSPAGLTLNTSQLAKAVLSGALTANTLATVVSITGQGWVPVCAVQQEDTTSRTLRLQVIVDGVTAFDATSAASTTANRAIVAAGSHIQTSAGNYQLADGHPGIRFFASCVIKIASSLTETDKLSVLYKAYTE